MGESGGKIYLVGPKFQHARMLDDKNLTTKTLI